jgi:hypothetical protein
VGVDPRNFGVFGQTAAERRAVMYRTRAVRLLETADAALIPAIRAKLVALAIRYEELAANLEN